MTAIDALPDNVLLEIFNFYVDKAQHHYNERGRHPEDAWHTLVHVCKRWRCIVFESPHRLNLRLLCTPKRPVKKMLDVWPDLPIVIREYFGISRPRDAGNLIAGLKQHKRVFQIFIENLPNSLLKKLAAIKKPFPTLTFLQLWSYDENAPVFPGSFLGGSAPRLQSLLLDGIPFPALGKLLMSTNDLVNLHLFDIPHSGYISPESMVTSLSSLTRLKSLLLQFRSPQTQADRENRPPPLLTRIVLPALTSLKFKGDSEYLEDIVSRVDTPLLDNVIMSFFNQLDFDAPPLQYFIDRTETFKSPHRADAVFHSSRVEVRLFEAKETVDHKVLELGISCKQSDWQLSSLAQVCTSSFPPFPTLEHLCIYDGPSAQSQWEDDMESTQWLELLYAFTSVRDLELSGDLYQLVVPALGELTRETAAEVLPALQNIFVEGPQSSKRVKEATDRFITARELSGCPVVVHHRARGSWR